MDYGARVERGEIRSETEGRFVVASLDREGIVSPPISALAGAGYDAGDKVYFFLFRDGTGAVLGPVDEGR